MPRPSVLCRENSVGVPYRGGIPAGNPRAYRRPMYGVLLHSGKSRPWSDTLLVQWELNLYKEVDPLVCMQGMSRQNGSTMS